MPRTINPKLKFARRLLSQKEISKGVSPFNGKVFNNRSKIIRTKELKKMNVTK